jgi:hypothetical protein
MAWKTETGEKLLFKRTRLEPPISFSPDGKNLIARNLLVNIEKGETFGGFRGEDFNNQTFLSYRQDGKFFKLTAGKIEVCDLTACQKINSLADCLPDDGTVAFSKD